MSINKRKNIWVVDDDPTVLKVMLHVLQHNHNVRLFSQPESLLQIKPAPEEIPDVILSDYSMPSMSGTQLLQCARRQFPSALRLLITGDMQVRVDLHCAHRILLKPIGVKELRQAVNDCVSASEYYRSRHALFQEVQHYNQFPVLEESNERIRRCHPQDSLDILISILDQDLGLYSRLQILANSPIFNPSGHPVENSAGIIHRLGIKNIHAAVLASSVFLDYCKYLNKYWVHQLFHHCLETALLAGQIAEKECPEHASTAYFAGILHDLGYLLLFNNRPEIVKQNPDWLKTKATRNEEKHLLGFHSGELAAFLLHLWGLPQDLIDAVEQTEIPPDSETCNTPAQAIRMAHQKLDQNHQPGSPDNFPQFPIGCAAS